jgi:hypothetical protein
MTFFKTYCFPDFTVVEERNKYGLSILYVISSISYIYSISGKNTMTTTLDKGLYFVRDAGIIFTTSPSQRKKLSPNVVISLLREKHTTFYSLHYWLGECGGDRARLTKEIIKNAEKYATESYS